MYIDGWLIGAAAVYLAIAVGCWRVRKHGYKPEWIVVGVLMMFVAAYFTRRHLQSHYFLPDPRVAYVLLFNGLIIYAFALWQCIKKWLRNEEKKKKNHMYEE